MQRLPLRERPPGDLAQIVMLDTNTTPRSILHDDKVYPDPHTFVLDRFLKNGSLNPDRVLDPQDVGFGCRMYPGRFMAYDTIWIAIVTLLLCAEVCPAKDEAGGEIEVKKDYAVQSSRKSFSFHCHGGR